MSTPHTSKTKTFRLHEDTLAALKRLADLTGLSYDELLKRAGRLLENSEGLKALVKAREEFLRDHPELK